MNLNPLLLIDFYKATHPPMYPKGITKLVSYFTPRMSRLAGQDKLIVFLLQGYIKQYLIEDFNRNFFNRDKKEVLSEYARILDNTIGNGAYDLSRIADLHDLGYLPLEIRAIPEGERVDMKVPMIEISNTHPNFAWLTNTIETMMSCTLWHAMVSANVGYMYRNIVNKYYDISVDDKVPRARALGDFSMRGQESVESAIKSSAAFCLSFLNTATVPAIPYLEHYYNCDCTKEDVAFGSISTEHSVMCSNYAVDGDEITFIRRLLTETYPYQSFSMVSDSYDYWNLITNILPQLKKEIVEHRGTLSIRGDSGDPVDIICGTLRGSDYMTINYMTEEGLESYFRKYAKENYPWNGTSKTRYCVRIGDYLYTINCHHEWNNEDNYYCSNVDEIEITKIVITPEMKGTIELLWERFGGIINTKGYKVLDPCIKAIYGDSITPQRLEEIYERATEKKFACNNVILGVGSFSMQCLEETVLYNADPLVKLNPYTRDTYGIAVKATYAEDADGKPIMIFKNPKTDTGNFKKSQRGCCKVIKTNGKYTYEDGLTFAEHNTDDNCLIPVFRDGKMIKEYTLNEIRQRLWEGEF